MKIQEIHIYGFGQLSNVIVKDISNFQVFFGENEAGKSTIMAFIHAVLFGFPTKQQSSELRYEPKADTKYGGKLIIVDDEFGTAVIERVKGKAAGDVTVALDNGTIGDENLLNQLLKNIDRGLYQAIFSFNIHGLQNIHQMKGEELGKFLFSTGTIGTERLAKTENELRKELENRFKPSGKKPIINEKLNTIHHLHGELKKAAAKNHQYESLIKEKESVHLEIENINRFLQDIHDQVEKLKEWKKIHTFVKEDKWIKNEMDLMGECSFPARGIERIEKLNGLIYPFNAQISSLSERINNLNVELKTIQPDVKFLAEETAILSCIEQVPLYAQFKLEKKQCESKLFDVEEKISIILERLHLPLNEEEVLIINTNIYMKNQVEQVSRKSKKLLEEKEELENKFQEEKNMLEDLEEHVRTAENHVLPPDDRAELEKLTGSESNKKTVEFELKTVQEKIDFYHQSREHEQKVIERLHKQKKIQLLSMELLLVIISLYSLFSKQWLLFAAALFCCLIIGLFLNNSFRSKPESNKKWMQTLTDLLEKEKELMKLSESYKNINIEVLQERLTNDNLRREQLQRLKIKHEQQLNQYEKIISKFEQWEQESEENNKILFKLSDELKIPKYIAESFFLEAFQLIEQLKVLAREKRQLRERIGKIRNEQHHIKDNLSYFLSRYITEENVDLAKAAHLLRQKLKEEQEKRIKSQEKQAKLADLMADIQQIRQEQAHLEIEKTKLLQEANVENESEFYELGKRAEKNIRLHERLEDLQKQLYDTILNENEWNDYLPIHDMDERIKHFLDETETLQARLALLHDKFAELKYEIQILEEGGLYSELLHQFKQKKNELEEMAKEWSVYCLAQDILARTVEKYKNGQLPRMLAKAEEYLLFLTEGNYHRIHLQSSGTGFLIERRDRTLFEANELSQATTEQIYVAIRLALATTLYEKFSFPIIIDDSFVNFDARRTQKVLDLLKTLKQNQVLFFTCHTHLLHHFQQKNVLYLQNGAIEVIS